MCVNSKLMCELDNGLDDELDGEWIWRVARFRISHLFSHCSNILPAQFFTVKTGDLFSRHCFNSYSLV